MKSSTLKLDFIVNIFIFIVIFYMTVYINAFGSIPRLSDALGIGLFYVLFLYCLILRKSVSEFKSFEILIYLLFVFYVLSIGYIVTVNNKSQFINDVITFIQRSALIIALAGWISISGSIRPMLKIVILNSFLCGVIVLINNQYTYGRLSLSVTDNPNDLGYIMLSGILALLVLLVRSKSKAFFWISIIILFFNNYIILLSGSRKNLAISLLCITLFVLFQKVQLKKLLLYLCLAAIGSSVTWYAYNEIYLNSKMIRDASESDYIRELMYVRAIEIFKDHTYFGVGFNGYKTVSGMGTYSHSTYMELLASTGLVGFVIYITVLFSLFKKFISRLISKQFSFIEKKEIYQIFCILLSLTILGFLVVHMYSIISSILFGIVIGYLMLMERNKIWGNHNAIKSENGLKTKISLGY